ncbi:hypothetical protein [Glutamicibacter protophormiae]|uniref:hypothetical protein n=1 Tax=Glutamicibacter protophormiae TaxID=37930 RepID=UPI00195B34E4|nr:hypothetical protein [Glutamicibacter protophormiae]QRQ78306.1 hypothetical protein JQN66_15560 [Glutamicibacter protophormiae]WPR64354.1 hypothetical protein SLW72_15910 [Glutamicibacter protophormiae]WPR67847.1 hypothetical protein SLW73_15900 [Glutamicibacter protophormiae]
MGFLDKAKEAISHAADRIKDPDKDVVENNWPAGETPEDLGIGQETVTDPELELDPIQGPDPDLDNSADDQYNKE